MEKIQINRFTIKQVRDILKERGYTKSHYAVWSFFKTKTQNGRHYFQGSNFNSLEITEIGIQYYIEYLESQEKFKNKKED